MPDPLVTAKLWAAADAEYQRLVEELAATRKQQDEVQAQRLRYEKELRSLLDATTPQRLFVVEEGQVVMVSATRGVEMVTLEGAAKGE